MRDRCASNKAPNASESPSCARFTNSEPGRTAPVIAESMFTFGLLFQVLRPICEDETKLTYVFTYLFRVESKARMVYPVQSVRVSSCCCTQFEPTAVGQGGYFSKLFPFARVNGVLR